MSRKFCYILEESESKVLQYFGRKGVKRFAIFWKKGSQKFCNILEESESKVLQYFGRK